MPGLGNFIKESSFYHQGDKASAEKALQSLALKDSNQTHSLLYPSKEHSSTDSQRYILLTRTPDGKKHESLVTVTDDDAIEATIMVDDNEYDKEPGIAAFKSTEKEETQALEKRLTEWFKRMAFIRKVQAAGFYYEVDANDAKSLLGEAVGENPERNVFLLRPSLSHTTENKTYFVIMTHTAKGLVSSLLYFTEKNTLRPVLKSAEGGFERQKGRESFKLKLDESPADFETRFSAWVGTNSVPVKKVEDAYGTIATLLGEAGLEAPEPEKFGKKKKGKEVKSGGRRHRGRHESEMVKPKKGDREERSRHRSAYGGGRQPVAPLVNDITMFSSGEDVGGSALPDTRYAGLTGPALAKLRHHDDKVSSGSDVEYLARLDDCSFDSKKKRTPKGMRK